jgi:hypothetical protein
MPDYRYIIMDNTTQGAGGIIPTSPVATPLQTASPQGSARSMGEGFAKRAIEGTITQSIVNPLNSATNGIASPIYQIGKGLLTGAGGAAIGAAAAGGIITLVMVGIRALQDRMAKLESEASSKNEREVLIYRAGSTSTISTYKANLFGGVQKVNRG